MKHSAGLLLYKRDGAGQVVVLIGHMGGPFWARREDATWSIPKGEYPEGADPLAAAVREFTEELGSAPAAERFVELGTTRQSGNKTLHIWAAEADFDLATFVSNTFELEWPPRSGRLVRFPELDRVDWSTIPVARRRLVRGQVVFLDRLLAVLAA